MSLSRVTGTIKLVENPRKEWRIKRFRQIQFWPLKRWKQIQARIDEMEQSTPPQKKSSRNTVYPTTLFSGTLFCGYCGSELKLYRSNTYRNHRQFWCRNGRTSGHGCRLNGSKSTRI